jgi:hypothetical protein
MNPNEKIAEKEKSPQVSHLRPYVFSCQACEKQTAQPGYCPTCAQEMSECLAYLAEQQALAAPEQEPPEEFSDSPYRA